MIGLDTLWIDVSSGQIILYYYCDYLWLLMPVKEVVINVTQDVWCIAFPAGDIVSLRGFLVGDSQQQITTLLLGWKLFRMIMLISITQQIQIDDINLF